MSHDMWPKIQLLYHANPCNHVLQVLQTTSLVYMSHGSTWDIRRTVDGKPGHHSCNRSLVYVVRSYLKDQGHPLTVYIPGAHWWHGYSSKDGLNCLSCEQHQRLFLLLDQNQVLACRTWQDITTYLSLSFLKFSKQLANQHQFFLFSLL